MDDIVKYQLKRAAASGGTGLGTAPIDVRSVLDRCAQRCSRCTRSAISIASWPSPLVACSPATAKT